MLKSIDLFSGIGGITHALRGIAQPVAYCEIDEHAQAVLRKNMRRGNLPEAPICDDVRSLDRKWLRKHVGSSKADIIVGGFPCVGFSVAGNRDGLKNEASRLFYEVLRVACETKAHAVFMENVPHLLKLGMNVVLNELHAHGYDDVRWCVVSAQQVGAPHVRKRWFCIATKSSRHDELRWAQRPVQFSRTSWARSLCPKRTISQATYDAETKRDAFLRRIRCRLLGNSVVPDAVRYAFCYLARGGSKSSFTASHIEPVKETAKTLVAQRLPYPSCGCSTRGVLAALKTKPDTLPLHDPSFRLVIDPHVFQAPIPPNHLLTSRLRKPFVQTTWATPSYGNIDTANYLTERNKRATIAVQVRFARDTPNGDRTLPINPELIEWIMGYPSGWTLTNHADSRS